MTTVEWVGVEADTPSVSVTRIVECGPALDHGRCGPGLSGLDDPGMMAQLAENGVQIEHVRWGCLP